MNLDLLVIESGKQKVKPSSAQTVDFTSVKIGASTMEIKETSGNFDFDAKKLTNIAGGTSNGEALSYTQRGASLGVASLDAGGKIPAAQLPNTVMEFQGEYNATTNTPAIVDGTGNAGDVYRVNVAGTQDFGSGSQTFAIGDWIIYNGTIWEAATNSNLVTSVNGFQGVVVLTTDDVSEGITNLYFTNARFDTRFDTDFAAKSTTNLSEGTNLYFTDTRARTAVVVDSIADSDTTHAPSRNAVFDALALKQDTVTASNGIKKSGVDIQRDDAKSYINDNAGTITVRQVVYVKANGNVDLAKANVSNLYQFAIGLVEDATILTTATGKITVRQGAIVGGFSGLTPGLKQYVSRSTAGDLTESLAGFVAGESVYSVGRAVSPTEVLLDPQFEFEY